MQDLGEGGVHPLSLARSEDDYDPLKGAMDWGLDGQHGDALRRLTREAAASADFVEPIEVLNMVQRLSTMLAVRLRRLPTAQPRATPR